MTKIQLDECIDCKRLAKACVKQNLVAIVRFPPELKTKVARENRLNRDELVLPRFLREGSTVLTTDYPIDSDNATFIPEKHPGIIIISNAHPTPSVKFSDIEKTIDQFKVNVPNWHLLSWDNSITEISLEWVDVRYVERGHVKELQRLFFTDQSWPAKLATTLTSNAQRNPPLSDQS